MKIRALAGQGKTQIDLSELKAEIFVVMELRGIISNGSIIVSKWQNSTAIFLLPSKPTANPDLLRRTKVHTEH